MKIINTYKTNENNKTAVAEIHRRCLLLLSVQHKVGVAA